MSILPIIQQALVAGFGEEQILSFLSNRVPQLAKGIKKAKDSGLDPAKILRFLSYSTPGRKKEQIDQQTTANDKYLSGIGLKTKEERDAQRNKVLKGALGVGAGALGLMGGLGGLAAGLLGGKPPPVPTQTPGSNPTTPHPGPAPMANAPGGLNQQVTPPAPAPTQPGLAAQAMPQQPQAGVQNAIINPNPMQPPQPQGQPQPEAQQREIMLNKLAAATPEFKDFAIREYDQGSQKSVDELFRDFHKEKAKKRGTVQNVEETPTDIKKDSFVATPSGIEGHIKSIKDKLALIEDEFGKLHKVKTDDLVESPLPEKDLADLHDELIAGIEKETEQEVSRNVFWAGYDPERNSLSYIPHGSGLYIYDDIGADDAAQLTSVLNRRKTSGNNFIGAWVEGTKSPIGSAMSALIRKLQSERGGKGNEYSHKFDPIYSAFEPAVNAAKKKKKAREKEMKKKRPHG